MERKIKGERLWPVLLVVDSLFIIVFGGAFAALVYQHWAMPPAQPELPARSSTALSRPVPSPASAPPAVPGAVPPPKPAAPMNSRPAAPAQPKPSEEEAAEPAPASGTSAHSSKAVSVEFRYKAPHSLNVVLVGTFLRKNGQIPLVRRSNGVWSRTVRLLPDPAHSYRYYFLVDGQKKRDPANPRFRGGYSLLLVTPKD